MKCEYCGNEVDANASMCERCGAPLKKETIVDNFSSKPSDASQIEQVMKTDISSNNQKKKNKKGNKLIFIFIVIIVLLAILIGSYFLFFKSDNTKSMNASEALKLASNNMKKLDNYEMNFSIKMGIKYEGVSGALELSGNSKIDSKNKTYYTSVTGLGQSMERYGKITDDKETVYSYDSGNEKWYVSESSNGNMSIEELIGDTSYYDIKSVSVKSDVDGLRKYQITMDMKKLSSILSKIDGFENEYSLDDAKMLDKFKIYVYINKDNYIEKIYMDLLELMDDSDLDTGDYSFDELSFTITFARFNEVGSVVIPENVINDANKIDDELDDKEIYDEEDIMEDVVLGSSIYCKSSTIDFANYNGELDEYLNLDSYDRNLITEGIIAIDDKCDVVVQKDFVINGKTCTYDDENYESCK